MFNNLFTTKMSTNSKKLKYRFLKITQKKTVLSSVISLFISVSFITVATFTNFVFASLDDKEYNASITNNGEKINFTENQPFYRDGVLYVPLREFAEKIGVLGYDKGMIEWKDGTVFMSFSAESEKLGNISFMYRIDIGENGIIVNPKELSKIDRGDVIGIKKPMNNPPIIKNNRTFVPFEYIAYISNRFNTGIMSEKYNISHTALELVHPCPDYTSISQTYGKRIHPITKEEKMHSGVDYVAPKGSNVVACFDGVIRSYGYDLNKGHHILIENENGISAEYHHLEQVVFAGEYEVSKGELIGLVGMSGNATGPHLHFELKINGEYVNPSDYIK